MWAYEFMRDERWDKDKVLQAVKESFTVTQVLKRLGLIPHGSSFNTFQRLKNEWNLDTSHFKVTYTSRVRKPIKEYSLELVLVENSNFDSFSLKKKLLKYNIFEHKCYKCNLKEWNGLPIPIELDHINGINTDNRLENLIILCPNCHAQTPTYRGKNLKDKKISKIDKHPSKEELEKLVWEKPIYHVSKELKTTNDTIKKWCDKLEIKLPPCGYWLSK